MRGGRAAHLAQVAADVAAAGGVHLPDELALWRLGGHPTAGPHPARSSGDPAAELCAGLERTLSDDERRRGAHYTPPPLAARLVASALGPPAATVVDPACGGGALLVAAGQHLVAHGHAPAHVARHLLWGADQDPLAAAITEAAVTLWSGGVAPAPGHVVAGDTLLDGRAVWPVPPPAGFDAVVANPPFQSQLWRRTARSRSDAAALHARFGPASAGYVDTAALFLLVGLDLVAPAGRVAMVQPQSVAASRGATALRSEVARRAALVDLWTVPDDGFQAQVATCVVVLAAHVARAAPDTWVDALATARGIPRVELTPSPGTVGDVAEVVAGFRDEYYALVDHVTERGDGAAPEARPLVTSGRVAVGRLEERPVRFARRRWRDPVVDVAAVEAAAPRVGAWLDRLARPKVVVASQTRVVEAAVDHAGTWVPATPVVSVVPGEHVDPWAVAVALLAPPVSAWVARRAAGTGMSASSFRMSARTVAAVPLPADEDTWCAAARALRAWAHDGGPPDHLAWWTEPATAMFGLAPADADRVTAWWRGALMR